MWHDRYHLFRFGSRPLVAVPTGWGLAGTARLILALPAQTWRQRLLRAWLAARARCALLPAPVPAAHLPVAGPLAGASLACMRNASRRDTVLLAWPARPSRRRFYALRVGGDGRLEALAKVGVESPDRDRIRNETCVLASLSRRSGLPFRVPGVLQSSDGPNWSEIEFLAVSPDWRPCRRNFKGYPGDCVAAWAGCGRRVSRAEVENLDWWRTCRRRGDEPALTAFDSGVRMACAHGAELVFAHGDLGPGNMFQRHGERMVFDWESCSADAPVRTDLVSYWLATHHRLAVHRPACAAVSMRRELAAVAGCDDGEIALALAFLIAQDSVAAERVAGSWRVK